MAKVYAGDPNCSAAFQFEPSALTADSIGSASLVTYYVYGTEAASDTSSFQEGDGSCRWVGAAGDPWELNNPPSDFPLEPTTGSESFSITFWYYIDSSNPDNTYYIFRKSNSFYVWLDYYPGDDPASVILAITCVSETLETDVTIEADKWYHIAITYDAPTKECNVRVYDAATEGVETWSDTFTSAPPLNPYNFVIGDYYGDWTGNMDDLAFFKDVLTAGEIDAIRGDTSASGDGEGATGDSSANEFFGLSLGHIF